MKEYKTVRELLSNKSRWCKGHLYATKTRAETTKSYAERCCLLGAIYIVYGNTKKASFARKKLKNVLSDTGQVNGIASFNDIRYTTHKLLMMVLDKAKI